MSHRLIKLSESDNEAMNIRTQAPQLLDYWVCEDCDLVVYSKDGEFWISNINGGESFTHNGGLRRKAADLNCREVIIRGIIE